MTISEKLYEELVMDIMRRRLDQYPKDGVYGAEIKPKIRRAAMEDDEYRCAAFWAMKAERIFYNVAEEVRTEEAHEQDD